VREWGLSARLGPIGYSNDGAGYLGEGGGLSTRPYAEATQRAIDEEVAKLLREAEGRATELLRGHRDALDRVVNLLLEKETIDGSELLAVLNLTNPGDVPVREGMAAGMAAHPAADPVNG
jgi:cell division protease FtsH